jgi:hypothetical protein
VNAPLTTPVFYTHPGGTFYSHRGQALGAGIGPAGDAQLFALDFFSGRSRLGLFGERRLRHMNAFYESFARLKGRDLELGAGLRGLLARGAVDLEWEAALARRWNVEFLDPAWQPRVLVTLGWRPGR